MNDQVDEPLRILLVTKGLDVGGIERMVVSLAVGLRRRGHHVEVALVNPERRRLVSELAAAQIDVHELRGTDRIGLRGAVDLAALLRSARFDVVHVHGPLPSVLCRLVPGAPPIITTSHTPLGALRQATRRAWRLTAWRDAARVAVSPVVGESIGEGNTVIRHGVDAEQVATARANALRRERHAVLVMCVASHRPAKNYPNLLRAIAVARDEGVELRLVALGEGPDLSEHRQLAGRLAIDDIVSFEMPTPDVLDRLAAADMLVVASDWEGQPMVVAEALAVGTPVVSTQVGQAQLLITDEVGRVVVCDDHEALGSAIAELARHPGLRTSMRAAACAAGSQWTLEDAVAAHVEIYSSVLRSA